MKKLIKKVALKSEKVYNKGMNYLRFLCVKYHILDFFGNGLKRGGYYGWYKRKSKTGKRKLQKS